jgi:hypothetical protein
MLFEVKKRRQKKLKTWPELFSKKEKKVKKKFACTQSKNRK